VTASGFFGKLPSRGDFVRGGLPRSFTEPWDAWLRDVLPASRAVLGDEWVPAWLEAPVWRFALAPDVCGPEQVLGLWMPSMDRAGRYFPLVLARTGGDWDIPGEDFLAMAEGFGRVAIADGWPPDMLMKRLSGRSGHSPSPLPIGSGRGGEERDEVAKVLHSPPLESPTLPNLSAPRGGEGQWVAPDLSAPPGAPRGGEECVAGLSQAGSGTLWWSEGSPRRAACRLVSAGMPCPVTFARMLDERAADHADLLPRQRGE
jgi:type VI secretion system protein ImpM